MQRTILVVDDDAGVRNTLARLLRAEGFDVATAVDGVGAIDAVLRIAPDLVLLDVVMPSINGFEVCRRIKENEDTRLIPVVLLTGLSAMEDRVRGLEVGADDFISKPPDRIELVARVRSLLRVKGYTDELDRVESILLVLARSIEGKDPYTEGHCERLSDRASALGVCLGLEARQIVALRRAGALHDIGKVAVPDSILLKRGALTEEEWVVVRQHPVIGEHICQPSRSLQGVLPIIRHHHEKYDGSGYPDGLAGEDIPLAARVLKVVDVYDALTSERSYKPAFSQAQSLEVMRKEAERNWLDPRVFEEFSKTLAKDAKGA